MLVAKIMLLEDNALNLKCKSFEVHSFYIIEYLDIVGPTAMNIRCRYVFDSKDLTAWGGRDVHT